MFAEAFEKFVEDTDNIKIGLAKNMHSFAPNSAKYLKALRNMIKNTDNWRLRHVVTVCIPKLCKRNENNSLRKMLVLFGCSSNQFEFV
jgi:hypothetical protein